MIYESCESSHGTGKNTRNGAENISALVRVFLLGNIMKQVNMHKNSNGYLGKIPIKFRQIEANA